MPNTKMITILFSELSMGQVFYASPLADHEDIKISDSEFMCPRIKQSFSVPSNYMAYIKHYKRHRHHSKQAV